MKICDSCELIIEINYRIFEFSTIALYLLFLPTFDLIFDQASIITFPLIIGLWSAWTFYLISITEGITKKTLGIRFYYLVLITNMIGIVTWQSYKLVAISIFFAITTFLFRPRSTRVVRRRPGNIRIAKSRSAFYDSHDFDGLVGKTSCSEPLSKKELSGSDTSPLQ